MEERGYYYSIHAEYMACKKATKTKGCSLLVIRLKENKFEMSKPCDCCMGVITDSGIKKIYYSNQNGEIECY